MMREPLWRGAMSRPCDRRQAVIYRVVIHPEELVADNFAQMMTGRSNTPNPEI